jgi:hypothetical protein
MRDIFSLAGAGRDLIVGDLNATIDVPPGGRIAGHRLVEMLWTQWRNGHPLLKEMAGA